MSLTLQALTSCAKQRLTSPSHFCCLAVSFKDGSRPKITHQWAGTTLNHHQPPGISGIAPMYITTGTPLAIVISKDLWWFFPLPQIFQSSEAQRQQVNSPLAPQNEMEKTTAFPVISPWFQQPGTACVIWDAWIMLDPWRIPYRLLLKKSHHFLCPYANKWCWFLFTYKSVTCWQICG